MTGYSRYASCFKTFECAYPINVKAIIINIIKLAENRNSFRFVSMRCGNVNEIVFDESRNTQTNHFNP